MKKTIKVRIPLDQYIREGYTLRIGHRIYKSTKSKAIITIVSSLIYPYNTIGGNVYESKDLVGIYTNSSFNQIYTKDFHKYYIELELYTEQPFQEKYVDLMVTTLCSTYKDLREVENITGHYSRLDVTKIINMTWKRANTIILDKLTLAIPSISHHLLNDNRVEREKWIKELKLK